MKNSGIYRLTCECGVAYIGQTGRSFAIREQEHLSSYRDRGKKKKNTIQQKEETSAFASHLLDTQHTPRADMDVLHCAPKGFKMNVLESMEIFKNSKHSTLLNDHTNLFRSTLFQAL